MSTLFFPTFYKPKLYRLRQGLSPIPFLLIFTPLSILGQNSLDFKTQRSFESDGFTKIVSNHDGNLVMVGNAGDKIHFVLTDNSGFVLRDTMLGSFGKNKVLGLTNTLDGGFAIVGTTTTSRKQSIGKQDAWLIKTDEWGKPLWDKIFGSTEDDVLTDIVETNDGDFLMTGSKANQAWLLKTDFNGDLIFDKTVFEKGSKGNSIFALNEEKTVIVGQDTEGGLVVCLNELGEKMWDKKVEKAVLNDVVIDAKNNLVITGSQFERRSLDDFILLKINDLGKILINKKYTGKGLGEDAAMALTLDTEGGIFMVGYTKSYPIGSRRKQFWVVKTDSVGEEQARFVANTSQTFSANDVILTNNLNVIVVGEKDGAAWLGSFGRVCAYPKSTENIPLSIADAHLIDRDGALMPDGERSYFEFFVKNRGTKTVYNLTANLRLTQNADALSVAKNVYLGSLRAGEKRKVSIPLKVSAAFAERYFAADELVKASVRLSAEPDLLAPKFNFEVLCRQIPRADIVVANHQFLSETGSESQKSKTLSLRVDLDNRGKKAVDNLRVVFSTPTNITPLSKSAFGVPIFSENSRQTLVFDFMVNPAFQDSAVNVVFNLRSDDGDVNISQSFSKNMPASNLTTNNPIVGRNTPFITLKWSETYAKNYVITEGAYFKVRVRAQSNRAIRTADFTIQSSERAIKSPHERVKLPNTEGGTVYDFEENIPLVAGDNKIVVKVNNESGNAVSDTLTVFYKFRKPNLYVLSVGVPLSDLEFSSKDAADFAQLFQNQSGLLFEKITIALKNTAAQTHRDSLKKALIELQNEFFKHKTLNEKDVVLLYVSSHGFTNTINNYFRLAASNYDELYRAETTLDFQQDWIEPLAYLPCKKVLFLDACHSGAVAENVPKSGAKSRRDPPQYWQAILNILSAKPNFNLLLSSQAQEFSYEDKAWQNSAFMKAIKEGLSNQKVTIDSESMICDNDGDAILSLGEISYFVQNRVPQLVKEVKKTAQTPTDNGVLLDRGLPIFVVKKP